MPSPSASPPASHLLFLQFPLPLLRSGESGASAMEGMFCFRFRLGTPKGRSTKQLGYHNFLVPMFVDSMIAESKLSVKRSVIVVI